MTAVTAAGPSKVWLRLAGLLFIAAGALLSNPAAMWLLAGDPHSDSLLVARAVPVIRFVALLAGSIMLAQPAWLYRFAPFQTQLTGFSLTVFAIAAVGRLGVLLAPSVDYLLPTEPNFVCAAADTFCNQAATSGVANSRLYGSAAAFVDIDADGHVDIFAGNADPRTHDDQGGISWFYLNNRDGTFRPVRATELGVAGNDLRSLWGASFADMDNDGDQDVAFTGGGTASAANFSLHENRMRETGDLLSVTGKAGLAGLNGQSQRWWASAWADYDNDGLLDLAVSGANGPARLLHNDGDNRFTEVTRAVGIATADASNWDGKNIVWLDFDNDGDQDLYFAGIKQHMFYENMAGKVFRDITQQVFAAAFAEASNVKNEKYAPVVFAAVAADFDQDGYEDIYLGRQSAQDILLFNDRNGGFRPVSKSVGIDSVQTGEEDTSQELDNTLGLGTGDILDDGWPDIIIGTGTPSRADTDIVICNRGGVFERCTELLIGNADGPYRTRGRGIAFGDANADGASDIFMTFGGDYRADRHLRADTRERSALFVSNVPAKLKTATLLLEGTTSNRDAIGARLRVAAADSIHYYTVRSTQGYQSQNERAVIIALDLADVADVEVSWPSGVVSRHRVQAGERQRLRE